MLFGEQFVKTIVSGYYIGTLMYANSYHDKDIDRMYCDGVLSVSVEAFKTYASHISEGGENLGSRNHYVWIASAQLNPL